MPAITLHSTSNSAIDGSSSLLNHLPNILQTPSGLAILEIQGSIHAPIPPGESADTDHHTHTSDNITQTPIGRLEFPLFDQTNDPSDVKWMKRVYLYVGKHQRLTGEVRRLPKPLIVISKRAEGMKEDHVMDSAVRQQPDEELEILEVIRHKILFGGRPEPVGE